MRLLAGKYIVFEGIDYCGKTTQSRDLVDWMNDNGDYAEWTREPGSPLMDLNVRDFVLGKAAVDSVALELILQADRAEHTAVVKKLIEEDGKNVVSDRSCFSGIASCLLTVTNC